MIMCAHDTCSGSERELSPGLLCESGGRQTAEDNERVSAEVMGLQKHPKLAHDVEEVFVFVLESGSTEG